MMDLEPGWNLGMFAYLGPNKSLVTDENDLRIVVEPSERLDRSGDLGSRGQVGPHCVECYSHRNTPCLRLRPVRPKPGGRQRAPVPRT